METISPGKKNIAVFASGTGSNALNLIMYFKTHDGAQVKLVVCNKKDAPVIQKARGFDVPVVVVNRETFYDEKYMLSVLENESIDFIVLAGFLWLIPQFLVDKYRDRIVNIHPALLPKYGGKGMYGSKVHETVKQNNETETGITIHYVDESYDEGDVIFQKAVPINCTLQSTEEIAQKVHALEYAHYPRVIEQLVQKL
ncbi:MAG: phosphoribosylglycinamide formyltransferase [Sphingobacteriales bacterium]|nr:MAG: phosphoribosylglycinamide formyltransferase [Sphingobacteriales bacterium]